MDSYDDEVLLSYFVKDHLADVFVQRRRRANL